MSISKFQCVHCAQPVETWMTHKPKFSCPSCGKNYRSSYKHSLKRSFLLGVFLWLSGTFLSFILTRSWPISLALSIEIHAISAALIASLYHKRNSRIQAL